jgi:xanthine dehydrogenase accessory factor
MNELQLVVDAYENAKHAGEQIALATVVSVQGSAYRRPGARMLITGSGKTAGTISGGCLERDVIEHAAAVMKTGKSKLVEYDTRGDDESVWGLGMGCNGRVRILIESVESSESLARAFQFIGRRLQSCSHGVMATVVSHSNSGSGWADFGRRYFFTLDELRQKPETPEPYWWVRVKSDAAGVLASGHCRTLTYDNDRVEMFFDVIGTPRPLVIFGAEPDAVPVARLARSLGWCVTVVDVRNRQASLDRFAAAGRVILCRAEDAARKVLLARNTAVVIMTHNFFDDVELLRSILPSRVRYVGVLGPAQRTEKLLRQLEGEDVYVNPSQLARLHAPIGVDIGAETPDEIALSIMAEVNALFAGRTAGFLRERRSPIHSDGLVLAEPAALPFPPDLSEPQMENHLSCAAS